MSEMGTLPGRPSGSSITSVYKKGKGDTKFAQRSHSKTDRAGTGTHVSWVNLSHYHSTRTASLGLSSYTGDSYVINKSVT